MIIYVILAIVCVYMTILKNQKYGYKYKSILYLCNFLYAKHKIM